MPSSRRPFSRLPRALLLAALLGGLATSAPVLAQDAPRGSQQEALDEDGSEDRAETAETAETASEDRPRIYEEIEVQQRSDGALGVASSATEGATGRDDLARRPVQRAGELVETVPGVIATQHSGGGKANQYFLRGFNLDHGSDFRITVGDMQVNMPTHGHGQGYADLNFLIPELIDRVSYRKGPYYADAGDFSSAGSVDIDLVRSLPETTLLLTGGTHDYGRALIADSFRVAGGELLAAVEGSHYDGPWERGDDYERVNALVRYSRGDAARGLSVTAMGYDGTWLSTDQIPRRAVDSGRIGRFGLIDPDVGGASSRYSLSAELHRGDARTLDRVSGYLLAYELDLFSNFTYFLDSPDQGDEFEQTDERWVGGLQAERTRETSWWGHRVELSGGFEARADRIDNGLYRSRSRERLSTTREDSILQVTGGPYAEATVHWRPWLRTRTGLRGELYYADVDSNLEVNSGTRDDFLLSPKASVILGPWNDTELYLNLGYGFHSNDARGATIRVDPVSGEPVSTVQPLVRARGGDVGFRTTALDGLVSTVSAFVLELDSELVFVGDAGGTEASRPSRRIGLEWTNFYRLDEHWRVDLDAAYTRARFTDDDPAGERIPGAIATVVAAGLAGEGFGPWSGALRLRYFGGAPLIEDDSVRSSASALVNAQLGYRFESGLRLTLEVFNLLDRDDTDIAYLYASRLPGEGPEGVEDIHFHPVEEPSARLTASWRL